MTSKQTKAEQLRAKLASAETSLEVATKGYKKMRQMRGAAAHKRVWYFEEQMQKWTDVIERVKAELAELEK